MLRSQFDSDMLLMEKNEIKKMFYKVDPSAYLTNVRKDGLLYTTTFPDKNFTFLVPLGEIGEVIWEPVMKAKLLIRWLQG